MSTNPLKKRQGFQLVTMFLLMLLITVSMGCQVGGLGAKPTVTPPPTATSTPLPTETSTPTPTNTSTSTPTLTPTPTSTFTLTPTPTKNKTATAIARATLEAEGMVADIHETLTRIEYPIQEGSLGWYQTEPAFLHMDEFNEAIYQEFARNLVAANFIIQTEVTWEASNIVVCGLMLRSEADFKLGAQYQFNYLRFSGLPAWSIEYINHGEYQYSITDLRFSSAIDLENGATNTFLLIFEGNKFTVYANDTRLGTFYDDSKKLSKGRFAFIASQDAGESTCTFENTWVWLLK
jgi:hypothetical protein